MLLTTDHVAPALPAVTEALQRELPALLALARQAAATLPTMMALPPPGEEPYAYGDLVPLSFVLLALEAVPAALRGPDWWVARAELRQVLAEHRQQSLWAFHSAGGLVTSVDSAFILRAVGDVAGVQALEQFAAETGGYYPQLFTTGREKDKMTVDARLGHWCRPDYTILAQVAALRARAGLCPAPDTDHLLARGFATRSGLFLASPYLVDWVLADARWAVPTDRLAAEVLASLSDPAARQFDPAFSTALGLSALARLGRWHPQADAALAELLQAAPAPRPCQPFYSSMNLGWGKLPFWELLSRRLADTGGQLVRVSGEEHGITLYQDSGQLIGPALRVLALAEVAALHRAAHTPLPIVPLAEAPARYRCPTAAAYVAQHALPPYLPQLATSACHV